MDFSAFERSFGVVPVPLVKSLDDTPAWYGEWLATL